MHGEGQNRERAAEDVRLPPRLVVRRGETGGHPSISTAEEPASPNACSYGQQARLPLGTSAKDQLSWEPSQKQKSSFLSPKHILRLKQQNA